MKNSTQRSPTSGMILAAMVTLGVFYPLLHWIVVFTGQNKQLMHSFIILAFAGAMLIFEKKERIEWVARLNKQAIGGFTVAYAFIGLSIFLSHNLLYLAALVAALYGWLHYLFGARYSRILTALLAAFSIFLVMLIAFPSLDWPLRILAGQSALFIFESLGNESLLFLVNQPLDAEPMLIVTLGDRPFHVAPECNGFGVLSAGLLLAILISVYQKPGWLRSVSFWISSLLIGLSINTLRIFIIMSLAKYVGDHYMLMHEIVGISLFWVGLLSVWFLGMRVFKPKAAPAPGSAA